MTEEPVEDWLEIGRIVAPQGLEGAVRVYPNSDFPERFLEPGDRWLCKPRSAKPEPIRLISGRYLEGKGLYVLKLQGINHREQAEALRDARLLVPRSERLSIEPGEFHVADLVGLQVRLQETDTTIGTVVDVYAAGNDLLAIELIAADTASSDVVQSDSSKSRKARKKSTPRQQPTLIPFVYEIVPVVDLEAGYVGINPPQGLIPSLEERHE